MAATDSCSEILAESYERAKVQLDRSFISDAAIKKRVDSIALSPTGAGIRVLMACALAKIDKPEIDIRKPYTGIVGNHPDAYSGRDYDQEYIQALVAAPYNLPLNSTTGFLPPASAQKTSC